MTDMKQTTLNKLLNSGLFSLTPPNIISLSRGIAAIAMLFSPVFSIPFWILYCWGGVSDMIDGPIARKTNTASELGSRIDSIADLLFLICSAIMVFPVISLPIWIWIWVVIIGIINTLCIILESCRSQHLEVPHTKANKLTGLLLFCLPIVIQYIDVAIPSIVVCLVASLNALQFFKENSCLVPSVEEKLNYPF